MKQKLTSYFTCILFKRNDQNIQTKEKVYCITPWFVCKNNCCGFECMNSNLGNQTCVGLIVKLYQNSNYWHINK